MREDRKELIQYIESMGCKVYDHGAPFWSMHVILPDGVTRAHLVGDRVSREAIDMVLERYEPGNKISWVYVGKLFMGQQ